MQGAVVAPIVTRRGSLRTVIPMRQCIGYLTLKGVPKVAQVRIWWYMVGHSNHGAVYCLLLFFCIRWYPHFLPFGLPVLNSYR